MWRREASRRFRCVLSVPGDSRGQVLAEVLIAGALLSLLLVAAAGLVARGFSVSVAMREGLAGLDAVRSAAALFEGDLRRSSGVKEWAADRLVLLMGEQEVVWESGPWGLRRLCGEEAKAWAGLSGSFRVSGKLAGATFAGPGGTLRTAGVVGP